MTTSSLGHRTGGLDLADLHWEGRRYSPTRAYGASKLANLLFAAELDRRLRTAGDPVLSIAAHPGLTTSQLLTNALARGSTWRSRLLVLPDRYLSQPVTAGIAHQLIAATGPHARERALADHERRHRGHSRARNPHLAATSVAARRAVGLLAGSRGSWWRCRTQCPLRN